MKRQNGRGSVYFDKSKNAYIAAFISPAGRRVTKRFHNPTDAESWLEDNRYNIRHNTFTAPTSITVGQWVLEYIETYKANVRPQTMAVYIAAAERLQPIADIPLQKLSGLDVQRLINSMKREISAAYTMKVVQLLNMAIKKAVALEMLTKNPIATVERPKIIHKKVPIYTIAEIKAMLEYTRTHNQLRLHTEIMVAAYTGMRIGEILALEWQDITPSFIHVRRTLGRDLAGMPVLQSTTKTSTSTRSISIPPSVYEQLSKWKSVAPASRLVFTTRNGSIIVPNNERRSFQKMQADLGLSPIRGFHALRHTHASQLLANGVPIAEVSKRLGHASPAITLGVYASWIPGNDEKIALDVDRIFK